MSVGVGVGGVSVGVGVGGVSVGVGVGGVSVGVGVGVGRWAWGRRGVSVGVGVGAGEAVGVGLGVAVGVGVGVGCGAFEQSMTTVSARSATADVARMLSGITSAWMLSPVGPSYVPSASWKDASQPVDPMYSKSGGLPFAP